MAETFHNNGRPPEATDDRGVLKIFLGYAPGVGKTFGMLEEAHRRKRRGQDVVVGVLNAHGRQDVLEEMGDLEKLPLDDNEELDLATIIKRSPGVILLDELEHTNKPGSTHEKRWQDVEELLGAGISVLTTCNVSSLESLKDQVQDITGSQIVDTIPDNVLQLADEIELVDLTPRALINRLERGDIVDVEKVPDARKGFFREGNLAALREIAMREAAGRVDEDVTKYRQVKGIEKPWATSDRILICVSPNRNSLRLIRKGWRLGQRVHGQVVAVHVEEKGMSDSERKILRDDFALAEKLGIRTVVLRGEIAHELIKFAKENNITQIVLGHPERTRIQEIVQKSIVNELIKSLRTVDIILIAAEKTEETH